MAYIVDGAVSVQTQLDYRSKGHNTQQRIPGTLAVVVENNQKRLKWEPRIPLQFASHRIDHPLTSITSAAPNADRLTMVLQDGHITLPPLVFENGKAEVDKFVTYLQKELHLRSTDVNAASQQYTAVPPLTSFASRLTQFLSQVSGTNHVRNRVTYRPDYNGDESGGRSTATVPATAATATPPSSSSPPTRPQGEEYVIRQKDNFGELGDFDLLEKESELPPRVLGVRRPAVTLAQLRQYFPSPTADIRDEKGFREAVFRGGLTPEARREAWIFFLHHRGPPDQDPTEYRKLKELEYNAMKSQWKSVIPAQQKRNRKLHEIFLSVKKDVPRTDRHWEIFLKLDSPHLIMLEDILMTYGMYNFDLGYVQGMSDLAAMLLFVIQDEVDTFWCFANWMEELQPLFAMEQNGMLEKLGALAFVIGCIDPELMRQLEESESDHLLFCFQWLLIFFKREFERNDALTMWDVLYSQFLSRDFSIFVCAAMVDDLRDAIVGKAMPTDEILKLSNDPTNRKSLDHVLKKAEGIYNQLHTYKPHCKEFLHPLLETWEERHVDEEEDGTSSSSVARGNGNGVVVEEDDSLLVPDAGKEDKSHAYQGF